MTRITRLFTFDAAHRLPQHPGKCCNLHGHTWKAEVTVQGHVSPGTGMVMDFGELKSLGAELFDSQWDHATLLYEKDPVALALYAALPGSRVVLLPIYPTSENLIEVAWTHFVPRLPPGVQLHSIRIWETANCCAEGFREAEA